MKLGNAPYDRNAALLASIGRCFLYLLILVAPFHQAPLLTEQLFEIQGLKPFNLLALIVLVFTLLNLRTRDKIEQRSLRFLLVYFSIFTVVFARSIPNVPRFHALLPATFPESYLSYIMSFYVVPCLYLVPFVYIIKHMCSEKSVESLCSVIGISTLLLSIAVVAIVISNPIAATSRDAMSELCEQYLGAHYNTIGTMFICTGPLLFYKALRLNPLWLLAFAVSVVAILLLQSRSALVSLAFSYCILLIQRRRYFTLLVGAATASIVLLLWAAPTIESLMSVGFGADSGISVNALLTGRVDLVWAPLLQEWTSSAGLFLFGAGRYGILTSEQWYSGLLYQATHAHNAIIDFFLDSGALLTIVLLASMVIGSLAALRVARRMNLDIFWALLMCIFGYFIGMLTEREVYPTIDNMLLFPIIAMMINLVRLHRAAYSAPSVMGAGAALPQGKIM